MKYIDTPLCYNACMDVAINGLHNVYAIMLRGPRGPDTLKNKKVFAGSDYLTASASRRYFNLGAILVQEKWTKLLKP